MATTKRKTTRKKRRTSKKGSGKTVTLSGIRYTRVECKTTESAAQSEVKKWREKGYTARAIGKCVYKGRKRKK